MAARGDVRPPSSATSLAKGALVARSLFARALLTAAFARSQFSATDDAERITPTCNFASSKTHPLIPLIDSTRDIPTDGIGTGETHHAWQKMEWNDKVAIASREVGSVVRFAVEGSKVAVFLVSPPVLSTSTGHVDWH